MDFPRKRCHLAEKMRGGDPFTRERKCMEHDPSPLIPSLWLGRGTAPHDSSERRAQQRCTSIVSCSGQQKSWYEYFEWLSKEAFYDSLKDYWLIIWISPTFISLSVPSNKWVPSNYSQGVQELLLQPPIHRGIAEGRLQLQAIFLPCNASLTRTWCNYTIFVLFHAT